MTKRVLISRPTGRDLERQAYDEVESEIRMKQIGKAPVYRPSPEIQKTRHQIRNYKSISELSTEELEQLRIKYRSQ